MEARCPDCGIDHLPEDYHDSDSEGFYVSVRDGERFGLLAGPFDSEPEAREWVEPARRKANEVNAWAAFYAFGTCKAQTRKPGKLNDLLGLADSGRATK